jgi:hypothetical protein
MREIHDVRCLREREEEKHGHRRCRWKPASQPEICYPREARKVKKRAHPPGCRGRSRWSSEPLGWICYVKHRTEGHSTARLARDRSRHGVDEVGEWYRAANWKNDGWGRWGGTWEDSEWEEVGAWNVRQRETAPAPAPKEPAPTAEQNWAAGTADMTRGSHIWQCRVSNGRKGF